MKTYLFVLAIVDPERNIRFHHTTVRAKTEATVYLKGSLEMDKFGALPVGRGEFANDYVVELSDKEVV